MKKTGKFLGKLLFVLSIVFIVCGIGLLIWLGIGQFNAQMAYDGQYIQWRMIQDISLWGYVGCPLAVIGTVLFPVSLDIIRSN